MQRSNNFNLCDGLGRGKVHLDKLNNQMKTFSQIEVGDVIEVSKGAPNEKAKNEKVTEVSKTKYGLKIHLKGGKNFMMSNAESEVRTNFLSSNSYKVQQPKPKTK